MAGDSIVVESPDDEIVKELVTPDIPRVDAVAGPAHGAGFLVVKSKDGQAGDDDSEEPDDTAQVEKAQGAHVGSPGTGSLPTPDPEDDDMDGTNDANSGATSASRLDVDTTDAAEGATGTAPGVVSGAPETKGATKKSLDFGPVAEALFNVRKALSDIGAPADVIDAIDNVGLELDNVAKANTGEEAGLDADGDDDGDAPDVDAMDQQSQMMSGKGGKSVKKSSTPETMTVDDVAKSLAPVFKSIVENALVERLSPLEKRLETVENQPQSGGPFLNGAAGAPKGDYYLVSKSSVPGGVDTDQPVDALEKALSVTSDPYLRERLQQEIARRMHPGHQTASPQG